MRAATSGIHVDSRRYGPGSAGASGPFRAPRVAWIIGGKLKAGQICRYRLTAAAAATPAGENVSVIDDDKGVQVKVGGKPVLVYNCTVVPSPNPKKPYYARKGTFTRC